MKKNGTALFLVALLMGAQSLLGQSPANPSAEEAIAKVLRVLSGEESMMVTETLKQLERAPWEALAYLDVTQAGDQPGPDDLQEAVPDYYRFKEGRLLLKLIDSQDHNRYGMELNLPYQYSEGEIKVFDEDSGATRDTWRVMYLDENYLALDMGDLRLFFTRTAAQER